jgi:2-hydroxy-6-oxonona-2,4-dienedioate hydrolase
MPTATLVVRGEHDPIVPQEWAKRLTAMLPKAQLVVIPGAAHAVNFNAPIPLARAVVRFLDR